MHGDFWGPTSNHADLHTIPTHMECGMFSSSDKLKLFALPA
jgi:hypothetical protein